MNDRIFDSNHISIEGPTAISFTEDVGARLEACGWQVLQVADANERQALARSLQAFVDTQASVSISRRGSLRPRHSGLGTRRQHRPGI